MNEVDDKDNLMTVAFKGESLENTIIMELPSVPRSGDHVTLDSDIKFKITDVHWGLTSSGLRNVELSVVPIEN